MTEPEWLAMLEHQHPEIAAKVAGIVRERDGWRDLAEKCERSRCNEREQVVARWRKHCAALADARKRIAGLMGLVVWPAGGEWTPDVAPFDAYPDRLSAEAVVWQALGMEPMAKEGE